MKKLISALALISCANFVLAQAPGCPSIDAGSNDTIDCYSDPCVELAPTFHQTGETTTYAVDSIPYAPPFPFTGGTSIFIGVDDIFSDTIQLPFEFCFFGNTYDYVIVGANGLLSFDIANAGAYCAWAFADPIPTNNLGGVPYPNSINGAYHDLDPSVFGDINYAVLGSYPCRTFVVSFDNVAHFDCNTISTTQQIVLYETTNVIEVYIDDKPTCTTWNSGNAVIGIQDPTSTVGFTPPNRNTGPWSASQEAWRFTPGGAPNYSIEWYDDSGLFVGSGDTLSVCPQQTTIYTAEITYLNCNLDSVIETDDVEIVVNGQAPSADLGSDIDLCIGEQTYLTPTVVGGTGPFNYNWNTGQFGPTIIAGGGNYTVTVTDANGCQSSDDIVVTAHPNPVISIDPPTATVCGGVPVVLTASGADIYTWSPFVGLDVDTGSVVVTNPQSSISYTVTGTSDYGCISQEDVLINVGSAFIPIITPTNISCYGATDGIITTAINAGTAPFQYSIDGGQNFQFNNVFDQLSAGTYDVIVTDGNGCLIQEDVTINPPSPQIEVVAGGSDVACNNTSTGDVWVESIVGGLPSVTGFTYTWYSTDNNQVIGYGSTLPGVPYGGYYVVAQDSIGCVGSSSTTITESTGFTLDVITTEPICVGGQEGSAYVTVTGGGVPPYSFDWSTSTNNPADTFQTLYNLIAGTYDLTITDKYGCDTTLSISINEPSLVLDVQMESIQPISCYADSTGIARAIVTGGESPYVYSWSSGHVLDTAWNLWSGTHDLVVTDIRGCTQTASVTITENTEMISDLTSTAVSCYGYSDGSAQVNTLSGGIPTYQYMWSNGHTSNTITNLSYGEYIVTTTDSTGCFVTDTVFISQPNPLQSAARVTEISCYGANDGELEAMVSGGVQSYSYQWLDGSTSLGQGSTVSNLPPSVNYQLQVTDANGCQSLAFASLSEPSEIQVLTSVVTPAYCEDVATGGISVVATGGTLENGSDYSYAWDNPGAFQQLTNNLTAQESGDYTVTVTDDNGCVQTQTINIPLQPTFVSSTTSTATSCFNSNDASTNVTTVGGYAPYTYEFTYDNGNVQTINSSNASYTQVNVPYGVYSVLIVDGNGCDISDTGFVSQPLALEYHIEKLSDQSCFGDGSLCDGKLQLGIEGGNSLYTYSWLDNQGNILGSSTISNNNISSILTIDTIDGLCEGFHTITVTDDKNCSSTLHINSPELNPVEILEGEDVSASINMQTLSGTLLCYGDSGMSASILNPDPRFTYDWYIDGVLMLSDTLDATNLPGGQLTAVANFLGCTGTSSEVTLQQPAALNIISQQANISCFGDGNGSITITTQGGTGAYDYQWSTGANTSTISSLSSGVYDVTIMDANNCSLAEQFTITEPSQLQVSVTMNQNQLTGVVSGGSPSYTYEWQLNNQTVSTSSSMTAQQTGYYVLTVTDANGCVESKTQYYEQPSVDVEQNSSLDIKVYPNPVNTEFVIEVSSEEELVYQLMSYKGDVVLKGNISQKAKINIEDIASGIYILRMFNDNSFYYHKLAIN